MPISNNNKMILYGGIGLAVVVVIIIAFIMMRKEGFNAWGSYTNLVTNDYTPGSGVMGSANYAQGGSLMLEFDAMGNISSSASLPIGAIIIWYGPKNSIPVGWVLCDGNNGTPNLSNNNFARGSNSDTTLKTTGGSYTSPLPTHSHFVYTADNNNPQNVDVNTDNPTTISSYTESKNKASFAVYTSNAGSGPEDTPIPTIPPYVAVYYIMKIQ
jgi:hypothetical protein